LDVFFDTEFTGLPDKLSQPYLISIGCVADGREFYAELSNTYHQGLCSDWVVQNVLPLLQGGECRMMEAELAERLKEWVESLTEKEVIFRSDCPRLDWVFIEQLLTFYGCWPKNLRRRCGVISFEDHRQHHRYLAGLQNFWKDNIAKQHHALVDARSLRFAWKYAIRRGL
jgi:hypothetical protein